MKKDKDFTPPESSNWMQFFNLGWSFAVTMAIAVLAGGWLDKHFNCQPIFLLLGVLLGFLSSGYFFYRIIQKTNPKQNHTN